MRDTPNASLLAPAAAARDALWRTEQRLTALEQRCARDFATLFTRLDALPAAVGFAPFEALPDARAPAADAAGDAATREVVRKRRKATGVTPQPFTVGVVRSISQALGQTGLPAVGALARGVAQGVHQSAFDPDADSTVRDTLLGLPGLVGHVVSAASSALLPQPGAGVVSALTQGLMARNPQQRGATASGFAGVNRLLTDALAGVGMLRPANTAALQRMGGNAAQQSMHSTAAALRQGAQGVGQVLQAALPGVGTALAGAVNDALQQGLAPRTGAARAPSRLLPQGDAGTARHDGPAPATPDADGSGVIGALFAAGGAAAGQADAITTQLNRLLLDQAWLRGVDLR